MTEPHVIGNEVEHQAEAAFLQTLAEPGQRGIAAEALVNHISSDCEAGSGNIVVSQIGERFPKFPPPLWVTP